MMNSTIAPGEKDASSKPTRGAGRGSKFFALGHDVWEQLWTVETANRLNLILVYFTLLAGTGSDHRLTKWSATACEQYLGIGKPRAKRAIEELISAKLIRTTEQSTRLAPQYELPELPLEAEPIFLPVQLVTGLAGETPVLRRIKEVGDALLLRMLVDLYGLVVLDATFGVPIEYLWEGGRNGEPSARKVASVGSNAVWALKGGQWRSARGAWTAHHRIPGKKGKQDEWAEFWERVDILKQVGAIFYEPWLFDSEALDAEPLMPLDPAGYYGVSDPGDEAKLTSLAMDACRALVSEDRPYVLENVDADFFVPLPLHHRQPALRQVARLRVEADTPGRRLAWKRRKTLVEGQMKALAQLADRAYEGEYDRPIHSRTSGEGA